jgi:hypothetical protein
LLVSVGRFFVHLQASILDVSPARLCWVLTTAAMDLGTFGGTYQKGVVLTL